MLNDKLRFHARVPKLAITTVAFALAASMTIAQNAGEFAGGGFSASGNTPATTPVAKYVPVRRVPNTHGRRHKLKLGSRARRTAHAHPAPTTTVTAAPAITPPTFAPTTAPPTLPPTTATTTPPTSAPSAGPANMIFDDEFNGSSLDLSKWQPNWLGPNNGAVTKPINSAELSCYDPAQVDVEGGNLKLTAAARSCSANNGVTYKYTSGLVETNGRFTFTYGHMEARIWLDGNGSATNWPAFWAAGTGTWPITGELDVMEGLGGHDCYHFHSTSGGPGACASLANAAGWHVFAADWSPGVVSFSYDGDHVGTISSGITSAPMYLILNLGVGGYGGAIQAPSTMLVDYVRVWKT